MSDALFESAWVPPLVWLVLYTSDYTLTLICARLYQAQDKIVFEGSYEITPMFQADINALRRISPRFVFLLVATTFYLCLMGWWMPPASDSFYWYLVLLGAMLLGEAAVHVRHVRNWHLFTRVVPHVKGRIEYPRGPMLMASALDLLAFAVLYAGVWVVTGHPFLLGGALSCASGSIGHYRLAKRHEAVAHRVAVAS
jgi:hypothetical protein